MNEQINAAALFFDEHQPCIGLRGDFLRLVVDGGDDIVAYRIIEDQPHYADGQYVRKMEVFLVPRAHVREFLAEHSEITLISRYLQMSLDVDEKKKAQP